MTSTTIKLDSAIRDRLNVEARRRGVTAGSFVEELLDAWAREQRFAAIRQAIAQTPPELLASYAAESSELDQLAADGLDEQ